MSFVVIDRRKNDKGKSTDNRHRFLRHVKDQLKESMKKLVANGSIKEIDSDGSKKIKIPGKNLDKPTFVQSGKGGFKHIVVPGNHRYIKGDRIARRPEGEGGGGNQGGSDGDGEDGFSFELTREEFLDMFFDDLALPNLHKRNFVQTEEFVSRRSGFSPDGNKLNIARTMGKARGRRVALRSKKKKKLEELEAEYNKLLKEPILSDYKKKKMKKIEREIKELKARIKRIPFIDTVDERYNRWEQFPVPTTKAVMFLLMDTSASMGQKEKELSKRFFMLLYWFLQRSYEKVEVRFIRHTQFAKEVDEDEFFYSKDTGGTVVSSGLEMIDDIIKKEYPLNEWNIYVCQSSDGDNWPDDSHACKEALTNKLLPVCQYFAYVQIENGYHYNPTETELWGTYSSISDSSDNFEIASVEDASDIYSVFRKLFEKRGSVKN